MNDDDGEPMFPTHIGRWRAGCESRTSGSVRGMAQTSRVRPANGGAVPTQSVRRKIRELLGLRKRQRIPSGATIELWLGIDRRRSGCERPARVDT